ncbi:Transcriptional regulatory protein ZraR [Enhygromyxa salina]|uniref:Transcriptional regulatory protein ZraR n=1 Tax=Enhygromyxa salina TaxID=215803 RepID=A0A2S9XHI7_9BACT|nr:Transcriptional regulatory protein ZraR [Enhygromyxa salina]
MIGLVGAQLDRGGRKRWERWRPTLDLCRHEDFIVDRLELLFTAGPRGHAHIVDELEADLAVVSPETALVRNPIELGDPWDFESVYAALLDFARGYRFAEDEDYLIHITTGTHVVQICLFLLTESRELPARLLQTSPPGPGQSRSEPGTLRIIDLDLSKYDQLASRSAARQAADLSFLKQGIETRNPGFNALIERIERVVLASRAPILLCGPTGSGKTRLARRIYELARERRQVRGRLVEVNCATLRGDGAMSALFGHEKGAFTGAVGKRPGLLLAADGGILFLDEIGELGLDEQAMLLRAIEDRRFLPMGSERETESDFALIAGTNVDLREAVASGSFRADLLARIDLWTFELPALRQRPEDIEPNLDYELERWAARSHLRVTFNKEARAKFLAFARSPAATWAGNFRDFSAAIERMATLADGARIDLALVDEEVARLVRQWRPVARRPEGELLEALLGAEALAEIDRFDRAQLAEVVSVCRESESLSAAGRELFAASRARRRSRNDADRLRKYLARFELSFADIKG